MLNIACLVCGHVVRLHGLVARYICITLCSVVLCKPEDLAIRVPEFFHTYRNVSKSKISTVSLGPEWTTFQS